jgi:hypothetical protein
MIKLTALLVAAATFLASAPSYADGRWAAHHPRRDQVNDRLVEQHERIRDGRRDGELTRGQARRLRREDHGIRTEERAMAAANGGHITRREQRVLDRREDRVSRQIHRERRNGR